MKKNCKGCKASKDVNGYWGTGQLNKDDLCADCAPVAITCALGERCEIDRVWYWDSSEPGIKKLRMCKVHSKVRAAKLKKDRAAVKRRDAVYAAQRAGLQP